MGAYSNRVIADGASYYWRLGESSGLTAVASVGGANGTISGGVTLGQPGAIADGTTAMLFDGTTAKIATPAITMPTSATVEAWAKTSVLADYKCYFSNRDASNLGTRLFCGQLVGKPLLFIDRPSGQFLSGNASLVDGQWHHIVWVVTATTAQCFVDGQADSPVFTVTQQATAAIPVTMGFDVDGHRWTGPIDDVAIYPRALSAAEVSAHYAIGRTTEVTALGVYAERVIGDGASNFWRLNEASGVTARDIVGAKDGTISGGVTLGQPSPLGDGTSAMTFNGTTGAINTAANVRVVPPCSIEAWIRPTSDLEMTVLGVGTHPSTEDVLIGHVYLGRQLGYKVLYANASGSTEASVVGVPLVSGQWAHVVWVFAGVAVRVYIDGVERSLNGQPSVPIAGSVGRTVGLGFNGWTGKYWTGGLDEVAIYPRALSASEIAAHYALSTVPVPRDLNTGLAAFLPGTGDLTTEVTAYLATLTGDMTARWKQMEKNAGF